MTNPDNPSIRCKICNLPEPLRTTINEKLYEGASHTTVVQALADNEISIAKSSIGRHAKDHLKIDPTVRLSPDEVADAIANLPPPEPIVFDSPDDYRALASEINMLESAVRERRVSQMMLEKIVQNQLAIVTTMQKRFMKGEGEYPRDPIAGLKAVMELFTKLPAYTDATVRVQNQNVDREVEAAAAAKQQAEEGAVLAAAIVDRLSDFHDQRGEYAPGIYYRHLGEVLPLFDDAPAGGIADSLDGPEAMRLEIALIEDEVEWVEGDPGELIESAVCDYPGDLGRQYDKCIDDPRLSA